MEGIPGKNFYFDWRQAMQELELSENVLISRQEELGTDEGSAERFHEARQRFKEAKQSLADANHSLIEALGAKEHLFFDWRHARNEVETSENFLKSRQEELGAYEGSEQKFHEARQRLVDDVQRLKEIESALKEALKEEPM